MQAWPMHCATILLLQSDQRSLLQVYLHERAGIYEAWQLAHDGHMLSCVPLSSAEFAEVLHKVLHHHWQSGCQNESWHKSTAHWWTHTTGFARMKQGRLWWHQCGYWCCCIQGNLWLHIAVTAADFTGKLQSNKRYVFWQKNDQNGIFVSGLENFGTFSAFLKGHKFSWWLHATTDYWFRSSMKLRQPNCQTPGNHMNGARANHMNQWLSIW